MKLGMDHIRAYGEGTPDEKLKFLQQMGVQGIMLEPEVDAEAKGYYEFSDLLNLRTRVESFGMKLEAAGGAIVPWRWHYKWMLGLPGKDEQIENVLRLSQPTRGAPPRPRE